MNKKLCAVCQGLLLLKSVVPQWVGHGTQLRVSGMRVVQECPTCAIVVTRRMSMEEFKDYSQVMNAVNSRKLPY